MGGMIIQHGWWRMVSHHMIRAPCSFFVVKVAGSPLWASGLSSASRPIFSVPVLLKGWG